MVALRVLVAVLLLSSSAAAADPYTLPPLVPELRVDIQDIPTGPDNIVVLHKGAPAPFDGQLFSNDTALRWGNWLEQYRIQTPLMLRAQERVCHAEIKFRDDSLVVRERAATAIQEDLRVRLASVEERNAKLQAELLKGPAWHKSRTFGIVLGAVGTLGVTALSIWAISAAAQ